MDKKEKLHNVRHSAAHLLAQAVLELFPKTKTTIGPVTETGFFYDFFSEKPFKEEDLPVIEKKMRHLVSQKIKIEGRQVPKDEARKIYKDNQFKLELIDGIPEDTVGVYTQGAFSDLCRGGHVESTEEIKHFKLTSLSGSYWRADQSGTALQRIYGIAFLTKEDLDSYLKRMEEAKLYDHRKLGKQLDLFSFHDEAPGSPFFHDKGRIIYDKLIEFSRSMQKKAGYQEIKTPIIMRESLWKTSGHYDNYKENMYFTSVDEESYCVRPMNCPSSILIYKEKRHSYRELPLKVSEFGLVHRYELSGTMHGLFRVRSFIQDDAHIYCTEEQMEQEALNVVDLAFKIYEKFDFKNIEMVLSTRPKKSIGSDEYWEKATNALENALKKRGGEYSVDEGGGAFYGPKIDILVEDAIGRKWQCGTVQMDFFLPQNFELEYIDSDQSRKRPVIIHRALYGSVERFFGILVEHFKGRFPFWLAPIQARVLTITDHQRDYAKDIVEKLSEHGVRVELDESGDQIGAQIRNAQNDKLPWMLVIGKKEQEKGTVTLRYPDGKQEFDLTTDDLVSKAQKELDS
jgi:threonyl-tRNA synthetase